VRVTAVFSRLLRLPGVWVRSVVFAPDCVVVEVALRRRRLVCPECSFSTSSRENLQHHHSLWRHLDLGVWRLEIHAQLRRLRCPEHGVRVEGVPFARHGARFTCDFEDLVSWLATRTDKTTITRLVRIDWDTVGRIIERVCDDLLDEDRLQGLFEIGIDEVSWRKQHKYLTLVVDHHTRHVVWGTEGAGAAAASEFFDALDPEHAALRDLAGDVQLQLPLDIPGIDKDDPEKFPTGPNAQQLKAISMDMGPGYAAAAREHAPHAVICIDPYHVVALANRALDEVRREYWNHLRSLGDPDAAKRFKDARWVLLKNPENLTEKQTVTYQHLEQAGGDVWTAYTLKEALRGVFAAGLTLVDFTERIDTFLIAAALSTLAPFQRLANTIAKHRYGILASIRLGITQGRTEAMNNKVRLITRRAYGFHSAHAALALVMLTCGPITLHLPHELH
jgi:transposase